jgi:hypothetical protein
MYGSQGKNLPNIPRDITATKRLIDWQKQAHLIVLQQLGQVWGSLLTLYPTVT